MMTLEECRQFYARGVQFAANLATPGLAEAFARVPREKFLGPGPWQIGSADARACVVHAREVCLSLKEPQ
jgi:protein-L-isoaspartate O-methyltransferase